MERLTHDVDFGLEDWEETLFFVKSDPNGAYNILDIARFQGEAEFDEILKNIALRLAAYEDTGFTPEEVQQMRWIPVEERLPEPTENPVLVHDYSGVSVAWHSKTMGWVYKTGLPCVDVTHWMPLPQPPKEENKDD